MIVTCSTCSKVYDDALCFTFCPHNQFISSTDAARKDAAIKTFDGRKRYRVKGTSIEGCVTSIDAFGYVSLDSQPDIYRVYDPTELEEIP